MTPSIFSPNWSWIFSILRPPKDGLFAVWLKWLESVSSIRELSKRENWPIYPEAIVVVNQYPFISSKISFLGQYLHKYCSDGNNNNFTFVSLRRRPCWSLKETTNLTRTAWGLSNTKITKCVGKMFFYEGMVAGHFLKAGFWTGENWSLTRVFARPVNLPLP